MNRLGLLLLHLVALAGLGAAVAGAGTPWIQRLPMRGRAEGLGIALAMGLGTLGSVLFVLGLGHGLYRWSILLMACAALLLGAWLVAKKELPTEDGIRGTTTPANPSTRRLLLAMSLTLLVTWLWSTFPPTGFDATTYHLPFARAFAESGRLIATPDLLFPAFPQLAEVLFAAMLLATGSDVTTHLVQFLALTATALLLYGAGRRFFSPWAGIWAAALWLAHPLAHYQAASSYVDLVLALFCFLAVYTWEVWRAGGSTRWLVICGTACGFAAATKYLGLLWLCALGLLTLIAGPKRRRILGAGVITLATLLVAGPWYVRIWHETGNPVHPLLARVFVDGGTSPFDTEVGFAGDAPATDIVKALTHRAKQFVVGPDSMSVFLWKASFQPEAFNRQSPLAPWNILLIPLAIAFSLKDRRLLRWLFLAAIYAFLWTTDETRFQLPGAVLMALAGAGAIHYFSGSLPSIRRLLDRPGVAWTLAAVLVAPGPLYAVYKVAKFDTLPPASVSARHTFLSREIPGYEAVHWLNQNYGNRYTLFAFHGQNLTYYVRGRFPPHRIGRFEIDPVHLDFGDARALHRDLRDLGSDHFLIVHAMGSTRLPRDDDAFDRLFSTRLQANGSELFELESDR